MNNSYPIYSVEIEKYDFNDLYRQLIALTGTRVPNNGGGGGDLADAEKCRLSRSVSLVQHPSEMNESASNRFIP